MIGGIATTTTDRPWGPFLALLPWLTPDFGRSSTSPAGPATPGRSSPRRAHVHYAGCAGSAEVQGAQGAARAAPPGSSPAGCGWQWTALSGWCPTLGGQRKEVLKRWQLQATTTSSNAAQMGLGRLTRAYVEYMVERVLSLHKVHHEM